MCELYQGMVLVSDGNNQPQPMRAILIAEALILQKEELVYTKPLDSPPIVDSRERVVRVIRRKVGGLGLSVKGGCEHKLPILISRIYKEQPADLTRQLYVGDAIMKVNNVSLDKYTHDDAVRVLKTAGNDVLLTVRHHQSASPFLYHSLHNTQDCSKNENDRNNSDCHNKNLPKLEKKWTDVITIPLLMAYITRYIAGSDKLRLNSFEISNHNGMFVSVIHCKDPIILENWVKRISHNIEQLNSQRKKDLNKKLVSGETVTFMTWVEEAKFSERLPWCSWRSRFFALKGVDVLLFDSPPVTMRDWQRPDCTFKVHQTMMKQLKDSECQDDRPNCFLLQSCEGIMRYFSVEDKNMSLQLELAWQRATYTAVTKLGSKTFPAIVGGKSAALTLDWNMGFALYDTEAKIYLWKYRFSYLKGSSDDGNTRLKLHFQDPDSPKREIETKELETPSLQSLLFCIHSFLTAKVVSVDPAFLQNT